SAARRGRTSRMASESSLWCRAARPGARDTVRPSLSVDTARRPRACPGRDVGRVAWPLRTEQFESLKSRPMADTNNNSKKRKRDLTVPVAKPLEDDKVVLPRANKTVSKDAAAMSRTEQARVFLELIRRQLERKIHAREATRRYKGQPVTELSIFVARCDSMRC